MTLSRRRLLQLMAAAGVTIPLLNYDFALVKADDPLPIKTFLPAIFGGRSGNTVIMDGAEFEYHDMLLIQSYSSEEKAFWDGENLPVFDLMSAAFLLDKSVFEYLAAFLDSTQPVIIQTIHGVLRVDGAAHLSGLYKGDDFTFAWFNFISPTIEDNR